MANQPAASALAYVQDQWQFDLSNAIATGEADQVQCTKTFASIITLKTTDLILNKLGHLVYGEIVKEKDWSRFITFCIRLWCLCIVASAILL